MHSTMKRFSVVLIVFSLALAARAQTNTNAGIAPAVTNASTRSRSPFQPTRPAVRRTERGHRRTSPDTSGAPMSLKDCIQEALQHNLDVQIRALPSADFAL